MVINNLDLIGTSFVDDFLNKEYELECLASDAFSGTLYTPEFVDFITSICNLKDLVIVGDSELTEHLRNLKDTLVSEKGDLLILVAKSLFYGKSASLISLVTEIHQRCLQLLPEIRKQSEQYIQNQIDNVMANIDNSPVTYDEVAYQGNGSGNPVAEIYKELSNVTHDTKVILEYAFTNNNVCEITYKSTNTFSKIPQFLYELETLVNNQDWRNSEYPAKVMAIIKTMQQNYPKDVSENPYFKDVYMDLWSLIKTPHSILSKLKKMVSVSSVIPYSLSILYPESISKTVDSYLQTREYLPYQEQLKLERGLGIATNDSMIQQTCAQTFTQQL